MPLSSPKRPTKTTRKIKSPSHVSAADAASALTTIEIEEFVKASKEYNDQVVARLKRQLGKEEELHKI
jgi:hypothetical protein